jgi:excisionase family DNA binding protein
MTASTKVNHHATQTVRQPESAFVGRIHGAEIIDVSAQTIDKFIRTGRLRSFRIGRKILVLRAELVGLVEANEIL